MTIPNGSEDHRSFRSNANTIDFNDNKFSGLKRNVINKIKELEYDIDIDSTNSPKTKKSLKKMLVKSVLATQSNYKNYREAGD